MLSCSNPLLSYNCHEYTAEVRGANLSHETQKKADIRAGVYTFWQKN